MGTEPAGSPRTFDVRHIDRMYNARAVRIQRARTRELMHLRLGDRVLDLGCGPGHLVAELAADVGSEGEVIGIDRQFEMLATAAQKVTDAGVGKRCKLILGDATALPLGDGSCEHAVAVQVLEYVPDVEWVLSELHRVLPEGGRAVLVDTDWRSCVWHTEDRDRTDRVMRSWETHFVHPHLPARLPALARAAGFTTTEIHALPIVETETSEDTYSLGMVATIARFVGRHEPALADEWRKDVMSQVKLGTYFFSLNRFAAVLTR